MAGRAAVSIHSPDHFFIRDNLGWRKFRVHQAGSAKHPIRVAGCGQPEPVQMAVFAKEANIGIVVDLREEAHGFIKPARRNGVNPEWVQITYTDCENMPNRGISTRRLLGEERKLFEKIGKNGRVNFSEVKWKKERFVITGKRTVPVDEAITEKEMVAEINQKRKERGDSPLDYIRVPVTDMSAPSPKAVDRLAKIYGRAIRQGKNILFHCVAGENRTTTALVLTRIMDGMNVHDALFFEGPDNPILRGNGTSLRSIPESAHFDAVKGMGYAMRLAIIYKFYDYWSEGHHGSFSGYVRRRPIDAQYLGDMMSLLRVKTA